MELRAAVARIWTVLRHVSCLQYKRSIYYDLQDGVDLTDELHPDVKRRFSDNATKL